jgi:hypothetical protein
VISRVRRSPSSRLSASTAQSGPLVHVRLRPHGTTPGAATSKISSPPGRSAAVVLLGAVGIDVGDWRNDAPELLLLGMAFTMSAPMVAWMRHRGHDWARAWEMTGAMFAPSLAAIALLWAGAVTNSGTLLEIQHIAMFPAMLAVMLWRRDEYMHAARAARSGRL